MTTCVEIDIPWRWSPEELAMLTVLILETDPIISLDLADAARAVDPEARIHLAHRENYAPQAPCTHAFLRADRATLPLVRRLAARGVRVFLLGEDRLPREVEQLPGVTPMPFPFTAAQLSRHLMVGPDADRRAS
jgi:hypothetical protein